MIKDIKPWKVISSKQLVDKKPWLSIKQECVELPSGARIDEYYTLNYPNWVNVIAITKDGKFVFERQYRHGIGEVNYEICAGVCEDSDSSPMVSAQRELMEETGYGNGNWQLFMETSANPGTHTNRAYCFLATNVEKLSSPHQEETEDIAVHLLSFDEVKNLLNDGEIKQAMMAAPLWKYVAEHNE